MVSRFKTDSAAVVVAAPETGSPESNTLDCSVLSSLVQGSKPRRRTGPGDGSRRVLAYAGPGGYGCRETFGISDSSMSVSQSCAVICIAQTRTAESEMRIRSIAW